MAAKTKKSKKFGRNANDCKAYKNSNRREKNKLRTLAKHLKKFPDDAVALKAVDACKVAIRGY